MLYNTPRKPQNTICTSYTIVVIFEFKPKDVSIHWLVIDKALTGALLVRDLSLYILYSSLLESLSCWKEQNAQQHGIVWTNGNHLPVVNTIVESWRSTQQ